MDNEFNYLLKAASQILAKYQQEKESGSLFNCVGICGVGTIETRHTEIIAALLDPQGNHGFGAESLKAFFRQCGLPEFANNCDDYYVQTEVKIPGRRPDIVIQGRNLCVVIENKTNTGDHYMQLADYRDWLEKQPAMHKKLLYLTYGGYPANDTHIQAGEYQSISYTETICNWLRECTCMTATPAADFCRQYADFIKNTICGGGIMSSREDLKKLLDSAEKIKAAEALASVVGDVKNQKYIDLFNEWAGQKRGKKVLKNLDSAQIYDGFNLEIAGNDELVFGFLFNAPGFRTFSYGLTWKDGKERTDEDIKKYQEKSLEGCNHWWAYSKYFKEYRNPGDNIDFLFNRKDELFAAMNKALQEMEDELQKLN